MAKTPDDRPAATDAPAAGDKKANYVVVARRYRPQSFADLVGQDQVVRALTNAIQQNRVAHAYLFTGARGVGKTSSARILAKCLNCQRGTSPSPCNECPTCKAISSGDDVDVIEIDGASNRGIDEMRELRQSAGVRPIQSRYKIYIIDEVHMLTREAFNALLKTLEEPPEHVKFILCTTEAEKIPITILSRCQRFDFSTVETPQIAERLEQIVSREGAVIDHDAALALARRAGGSMRDSQSLLEQLLAFGGKAIRTADVHAMLGTADDERVGAIVSAVVEGRADVIFAEVDAAVREGVDPGQLLDQLLGYFRDLMVVAAGAPPELCLFVTPEQRPALAEAGRRLGLETTLAIQQILAETKSRLRYSTQGRILVELALVRASQLENLDDLKRIAAELRGQLPASGVRSGPATTITAVSSAPAASRPALPSAASAPPASPASRPSAPASESGGAYPPASGDASKKNAREPEPASPRVSEAVPAVPASTGGHEPELIFGDARSIWSQMCALLSDMTADYASHATSVSLRPPAKLVATFPSDFAFHKKFLERSDKMQSLQKAAQEVLGRQVGIELRVGDAGDSSGEPTAAVVRPAEAVARPAPPSAHGPGSSVNGANGHANGSGSYAHGATTNGAHASSETPRAIAAPREPEPVRPAAPARPVHVPRPSDPAAERAVQQHPMFLTAVEKLGAKLLKAEAPPPPDANAPTEG